MTAPDQADSLSKSPNTESSPAAEGVLGADINQDGVAASSAKGPLETVPADLPEQLAKARKEAADNYEKFVRSAADFDNFRRRTIREKDELRQYATSRVLEDLLPVLDNLALGLAAAKVPAADLKNLVGGIGMVQEQLKTTLGNHGLKEINPSGQPFDPNQHESIASQPSATIGDGSVLQVVRIGYSLNGRLLRPASVIVSSGPAKEEKQG